MHMAYDKRQTDKIWNEFISGKGEDEKFIQKQMDIAAQIDNYLKENGWTQKRLADKAGLRPSQLSQILAGEANPTLKTIASIEEALGRDIIVCPDFHEEDMEEQGRLHPGKSTFVTAGSYRVEVFESHEVVIPAKDWQEPIHARRKQYSSASEYHLKPTGTHG
jgi:transcriptional regulator with XRE-family HTH domain